MTSSSLLLILLCVATTCFVTVGVLLTTAPRSVEQFDAKPFFHSSGGYVKTFSTPANAGGIPRTTLRKPTAEQAKSFLKGLNAAELAKAVCDTHTASASAARVCVAKVNKSLSNLTNNDDQLSAVATMLIEAFELVEQIVFDIMQGPSMQSATTCSVIFDDLKHSRLAAHVASQYNTAVDREAFLEQCSSTWSRSDFVDVANEMDHDCGSLVKRLQDRGMPMTAASVRTTFCV